MRSTFKVLFYVKKGSEKPNGNLPLMCRITVDGEIKQFSCKMDVPPRLWDVRNSRASGKSVEAQRINLAVDKIRVEVNRRYQELMQTDGYGSPAGGRSPDFFRNGSLSAGNGRTDIAWCSDGGWLVGRYAGTFTFI